MGRFIFLLFFTAFIFSCKKDEKKIIYGYQFFPFTQGNYVTYDVVDIFHDLALNPAHDTNYYQIKEVIGEEELDGENQVYRKLHRYKRQTIADAWTLKDVWVIKRTKTNAEVVEENKRRIAMAFSISYDQEWNYNALNEDEALNAYYENIYEPLSLGNISYDSTVRVEIEKTLNFIEFKRQYSIYAANIGKIYGVKKNLEITNTDTLAIQKGTELFYTAVAFGVE